MSVIFFLNTFIHLFIDEEIKRCSLDNIKRWAIDENTDLGQHYSKYDREGSSYYKETPSGSVPLASSNPRKLGLNPTQKKHTANSIEEVLGFNCKDEIPFWCNRIMTAECPQSEPEVLLELNEEHLLSLQGLSTRGGELGHTRVHITISQSVRGDWFLGWG